MFTDVRTDSLALEPRLITALLANFDIFCIIKFGHPKITLLLKHDILLNITKLKLWLYTMHYSPYLKLVNSPLTFQL